MMKWYDHLEKLRREQQPITEDNRPRLYAPNFNALEPLPETKKEEPSKSEYKPVVISMWGDCEEDDEESKKSD